MSTTASTRRFAIVCPNFHPRTCGVGDHSMRLGAELARRGHEVALFTRAPASAHPDAPDLPVLGAGDQLPLLIARRLSAAIVARRPTDVIIQFTPQMWDGSRFGSAALPWLARRVRRAGARVTLIAHELWVPWLPRPDLAAASAAQRVQFGVMLALSDRTLVTTESRARDVARLARLVGAPPPGVIRVGPNALPAAPDAGPRAPTTSRRASGYSARPRWASGWTWCWTPSRPSRPSARTPSWS